MQCHPGQLNILLPMYTSVAHFYFVVIAQEAFVQVFWECNNSNIGNGSHEKKLELKSSLKRVLRNRPL